MNSFTLTTASVSPCHYDTRKKRTGISAQIPRILVNQRLGKIKLEDDMPAPIKKEAEVDSNEAISEAHDGETFTEEFVVTKEDVSSESPEEAGQGQEDERTSCTCQPEIESLKDAVKELALQVQKQN